MCTNRHRAEKKVEDMEQFLRMGLFVSVSLTCFFNDISVIYGRWLALLVFMDYILTSTNLLFHNEPAAFPPLEENRHCCQIFFMEGMTCRDWESNPDRQGTNPAR